MNVTWISEEYITKFCSFLDKKTSFLSILLLTNIQRLELSSRGIRCENDCEKICKKTAVIKILFILGFTNYDLSESFSI